MIFSEVICTELAFRLSTAWLPIYGWTVKSGKVTYNVEDPRYRLLTAGADVDSQTEIDPTQRAVSQFQR